MSTEKHGFEGSDGIDGFTHGMLGRLQPGASKWWLSLGLVEAPGNTNSANDRRLQAARFDVLRKVEPVWFEKSEIDSVPREKSHETLVAEMQGSVAQVTHDIKREEQARQQLGWDKIHAAYSAPDAQELIDGGEWVGFTRAQATAWCWNLYQYEPSGFIMPNSILREKRVRELESGLIPDGFGYAIRARSLEAEGLTPQSYRRAKIAFGAKTYTKRDVQYSVN